MKNGARAVAVIVTMLAGCKGKDTDWRTDQSRLEHLLDEMRACTEKACGDDVHKKVEAWRADVDARHGKDATWPHDVKAIYDDVGKHEAKIAEHGLVAEMTRQRDTGCACKDTACIGGVLAGAQSTKLRAESTNVPNTISDDERKKVEDLYQQLVACNAKLGGSAAP